MVTLPDGSTMSRADLPDRTIRRWVASRKALIVRAVEADLITAEEACQWYRLSDEELTSWRAAVADYGVQALRVTSVQKYRQNSEEKG